MMAMNHVYLELNRKLELIHVYEVGSLSKIETERQ